jgi:hypothetical protein
MPDFTDELKEGIQRTALREIDRSGARRGEDLESQDTTDRNALGGLSGPQDPAEFATGYDAGTGETTTPFIFGISLFGGEDIFV